MDDSTETNPWKFKTFALVVKDNTAGEDVIEVWPYELLPFEDNDVSKNNVKQEQDVVDIYGAKKKVSIDRQSKLEARWYPTTDGRQTPPNVVNGETVEIYQYGQDDEYRWVSGGRQPELRRLEHVVHAYSNLKTGRVAFDGTSSYGWTISTREKYIRFWTRMSDGEKHEYQWLIDTDKSKILLHDNVGNLFGLHSETSDVYIRNKDNTYFRAFGTAAHINANGGLDIVTPQARFSQDVTIVGTLKVDRVMTNAITSGSVVASLSNSSSPVGGLTGPSLPGIQVQTEFKVGDDIPAQSSGSGGGGNARMVRAAFIVEDPDSGNQREVDIDAMLKRLTDLEEEVRRLKA